MRGRSGVWGSGLWALALAGAGAACGDNVIREEAYTATSGTRLMLMQLRFDDGAELPMGEEFFDRELHVRCAPGLWADGAVRCVPAVDDAVFSDAACETALGRVQTPGVPLLFLAYDARGGRLLPARLFRAGAATDALEEHYELREGVCTGPVPSPPEAGTYFAVTGEIDPLTVVRVTDGEAGYGRLGLRVRESDDGARVPLGLVDRELGVACSPAPDGAGGVQCAPLGAAPAAYYRDPACRAALVAVPLDAPAPRLAEVVEASGCAGYRTVAGEVPLAPLYRREGTACVQAAPPPETRMFATVAEPLSLAPVARVMEDAPDRRLQRFLLEVGGLTVFDDRLYDTGTRAECRARRVGETPRCLPSALAPVRALFAPGCAIELPIAEVPQPACEPVAFAVAGIEGGLELRAIGDRPAGALFRRENGVCVPYPDAAETQLRSLGPLLDPESFVGAIYFGGR